MRRICKKFFDCSTLHGVLKYANEQRCLGASTNHLTPQHTPYMHFRHYVTIIRFGPTLAALFSVVPKERRGSAQGLFSMLTAAGNIAPVLVGSLAGGGLGQYSLGNVLLGVVGGCYVVSAALFTAAALREDQRIQATWEDRNSGFESSSLLLEEDEQEEQKGKVEQQRVKE